VSRCSKHRNPIPGGTVTIKAPPGLDAGGRKLWRDIVGEHSELDPAQLVQLHEACRAKDRCDKLDGLLRGEDSSWLRIAEIGEGGEVKVMVDAALAKANETANLMKQLLAALRLPDRQSGKRPQVRGGSRGAYAPSGKVSSLEAARLRAGG
jgi:hypothetical protein